jgi:hypothetical protein
MFWGNSTHSKSIFITQKLIVRIIMKAKAKDSCREIFSKLGILTLYSQCIQGGSNMTGTDFFFFLKTIIAKHLLAHFSIQLNPLWSQHIFSSVLEAS